MSLVDAHAQGFKDALARYGVKQAGLLPAWHPEARWGTQLLRGLIGHPDIIAKEGLKPFQAGGPLNLRRMLWPGKEMPAPYRWLSRAGTAMSALPLIDAIRGGGDPNEGRMSNALGHAGGVLGAMYGGSALGVLGAPLISSIGSGAGKMLGHALGSRPAPPPQPPVDPNQQYYPQGGYG